MMWQVLDVLLLCLLQELPVFVRLLSTLGDPLTLSLGAPCSTTLLLLTPDEPAALAIVGCSTDVRLDSKVADGLTPVSTSRQ